MSEFELGGPYRDKEEEEFKLTPEMRDRLDEAIHISQQAVEDMNKTIRRLIPFIAFALVLWLVVLAIELTR